MTMLRRVKAFVLAGVLVLASGCGESPSPEDCASGVAVVWSSQTARPTRVELWDVGGKRASITADVQGVSKTAEFAGEVPSPWFVSNGNTIHDQSNIGRLDRETCSVQLHRLKEPGIQDFADVDGTLVVSNVGLRGRSWLDSYSSQGDLLGTFETNKNKPGALAVTAAGELLVLTNEDSPEGEYGKYGPMRVLKLKDNGGRLVERGRTELSGPMGLPPVVSGPDDGTVVGDEMFFSIANLENQDVEPIIDEPRDKLGVVNLRTGEVDEIQLERDVPYQVEQYGGMVYVAHTYLNPAIREFEEYRYISRVDPKTRKVETFDVGPRVNRIAFSDGRLYVLHYDAVETPVLGVYDPVSMKRLASHELKAPGGGHFYIGAIGMGVPAKK